MTHVYMVCDIDLDTLFIESTEIYKPSLTSSHAAVIQMSQEHACGVHFMQRLCDDGRSLV